jgi:hypothetical protein
VPLPVPLPRPLPEPVLHLPLIPLIPHAPTTTTTVRPTLPFFSLLESTTTPAATTHREIDLTESLSESVSENANESDSVTESVFESVNESVSESSNEFFNVSECVLECVLELNISESSEFEAGKAVVFDFENVTIPNSTDVTPEIPKVVFGPTEQMFVLLAVCVLAVIACVCFCVYVRCLLKKMTKKRLREQAIDEIAAMHEDFFAELVSMQNDNFKVGGPGYLPVAQDDHEFVEMRCVDDGVNEEHAGDSSSSSGESDSSTHTVVAANQHQIITQAVVHAETAV